MDHEQYGITDLTHYMNGRPIFTAIPQPPSQPHDHLHHYDMAMLGGSAGGMLFRSDSTAGTASTTASLSAGGGAGLEIEIGGGLENEIGGGGGGNCRWPRQETLTLLEVRSSLDSKFKEANHKGPLWDEVSRIMCEEHGYQRSGKKCREKFENLYKYYKKTKEGKAGRQDGKHYRFFRQLEAIYGEAGSTSINPNSTSIPTPFSDPHHNLGIETCGFQAHQHSNTNYQQLFKPAAAPPSTLCDSPSLSNNSSAFDTCSSGYSNPKSDGVDRTTNKRRLGKCGWKTKIKEFVDAQMKKVMEKQEEWMEKMMRSIEQKEQERVLREEQWRKEETARFEKEHKFWANERAWMESRDSALMEALQKLNDKESHHRSSPSHQNLHNHHNNNNGKIDTAVDLTAWGENELTRLIQLRSSMETRFEHGVGHMEEVLWEEISSKMACMGYTRNAVTCKSKWDSINEFLLRTKKRKDNTRSSDSYAHQNNESLPHILHHQAGSYRQEDQRLVEPANDEQNDGGHRFLVVDQENMWDGYGMKLRMGENH